MFKTSIVKVAKIKIDKSLRKQATAPKTSSFIANRSGTSTLDNGMEQEKSHQSPPKVKFSENLLIQK